MKKTNRIIVSFALIFAIFSATVVAESYVASAADIYTGNLLQNDNFNYNASTHSYDSWDFITGENKSNKNSSAHNLIDNNDGWDVVPATVSASDISFVKKGDGNNLLLKTVVRLLDNLGPDNAFQHITRIQQTINTIPGTTYQVKIPVQLIEKSRSTSEPRYAIYISRTPDFASPRIATLSWTKFPITAPYAASVVTMSFKAVTDQTTITFSVDEPGGSGYIAAAGDYFIASVFEPSVTAQIMKTDVKGRYHSGQSDAQELYSYSLYDVNSTLQKSVKAIEFPTLKLAPGEENPRLYVPETDGTIVFDYTNAMVDVTIKAVKQGTTELVPYTPNPRVISVPAGVKTVIYAPHIPGWTVVGTSEYEITPVDNTVLTFEYTKNQIPELERDDHIRYIYGYPDGTVGPDRSITRAEAATIFFRLLKDAPEISDHSDFSDIKDDEWFAPMVSTLADYGIIFGYPDGTFRPGNYITRAEFAAVASRFDELSTVYKLSFDDVKPGYWAYEYINSAFTKGWVSGYPENRFMPEANITRAEAAKIINHILIRHIEVKDLPEGVNHFTDLTSNHWAYNEILEASTAHSYVRNKELSELWTLK